jgi:glycosyltransferase involved in cell wall biosynthesis
MKINIIVPLMPYRVGGGHKIMYEYSNRLSQLGHDVTVYHSIDVPFVKFSWPLAFRFLRAKITRISSRPNWFEFCSGVKTKTIYKIKNQNICDGDIIFFTCSAISFEVAKLSQSKGKIYNLIQDYEDWILDEVNLHYSYSLKLKNIVINDYLYDTVKKVNGQAPFLIHNSIDKDKFYIKNKIETRKNRTICMLYSEEERKGSWFGIHALENCKKVFPDLEVILFSGFKRNSDLPKWMSFQQSPNNLIDIYNSCSIFFSPSNGEGWALPPAEAMNCGCAVVCTDILGHSAYAIENKTAVLVEPRNIKSMTEKLIELLSNTELRISIASEGNTFIKKFSWNENLKNLENVFYNS